MTVHSIKTTGFCFGVRNAVERAEDALKTYPAVYCVGEIAHNKRVCADLAGKGLITVGSVGDAPDGAALIIRAHGLPESAYIAAKNKNLNVIDCSCKYVAHIHNIVKERFDAGFQIIIAGDREHPEVIGTCGWCGDSAIVISDPADVERLVLIAKPLCVITQTTFDNDKWREICKTFKQFALKSLEIFDTICYTISVRQDETAGLASRADKMLVLGDRKSSNTGKLYAVSQKYCPDTYLIESLADLSGIAFRDTDFIGITAGASTPAGYLAEVIEHMTKLNNEATSQEFMQGVEDSLVSYRPGKRVKGTVISCDETGVHVNIGGKKDGFIPVSDGVNPGDLKPGDAIEAIIKGAKGSEGVLLSKKEMDDILEGDKAVEQIRDGSVFELVLGQDVKGGIVTKLGTYRVFVPASQIRDHYVADLKQFAGKKMRLIALEIDDEEKKIVASALKVVEKERKDKEDAFWNSLEAGLVVSGKVKRIAEFGAFVSVNGFDCLAHNTDLSWNRVFKADDIVKIGQRYDFVVLTFDREKNRVSLGYKQLQPKPWEIAVEKYPVGTVAKGKVARITKFGAFVELEPGIDALCFLSEISHTWIQNVSEALKIGDEVEGKIIKNEEDGRKLTFSIKAVQEEPHAATLQEQIEQELALADADEAAENKKKKKQDKANTQIAGEEFEKLEASEAAAKKERAPRPDAKAKFEARAKNAAAPKDRESRDPSAPRRPRPGSDSPDSIRQWSESASNNPFADLLKNLDLDKK